MVNPPSRGSTAARFVKNRPDKSSGSNRQNRPEGNFRTMSNKIYSADTPAFGSEAANGTLFGTPDTTFRPETVAKFNALDEQMGFEKFDSGQPRLGWLINMHTTTIPASDGGPGTAGVDYYFLDAEGGAFKATVPFDPYFLLSCKAGSETDVEEYLRRKFEKNIKNIDRMEKEDLEMPNHLLGLRRQLLRLSFHTISELQAARRELLPLVEANRARQQATDTYARPLSASNSVDGPRPAADAADSIDDIREYDVPFHVRVAIDKDIRVGKWYHVAATPTGAVFTEEPSRVTRADPVVLAFDIETTKAPLKFPDASTDQIMMISYMIDGDGFLITNREIIAEEIADFEYTPKPEYPGVFTVFNEADEAALLRRFFQHVQDAQPTVIATFNGDFFDWPFVETRAAAHGISLYEETGFIRDSEGEFRSRSCAHMDCFRWVKRDSYLPQGAQGLKAVTTAKLGYNPIELDPELMYPYARERPQLLSEYSVSDAVATYYLYMKYVHPFIFSLCNIIPLGPDEVLRKGTGTLCEMLLMVQAFQNGILLPNKHKDPLERFYNGHLLETETYVGGHVESLEAGVFRSDLPAEFTIDPTAVDELLRDLDAALKFSIEIEAKTPLKAVTNYAEVRAEIEKQLIQLRAQPRREDLPLIYHVDVASMYPNIMTTNRLQPDSMKAEEDCAACDFNVPGKSCDRRLPWMWRGEFFPAAGDEYNMLKRALQNEQFPRKGSSGAQKTFRNYSDLPYSEQVTLLKKRLGDYSRKVYHRVKQTHEVQREAVVCQRENPFYVDTVRSFRDRRYEFKTLQKEWKKKLETLPGDDAGARDEARKRIVLYDSLQLAHKVILNSFYGYVMRKGSRWYSMEMAGVTCYTGATIIQMARALVERLGRPLELDTDGIWCILPSAFPENFTFNTDKGKKIFISYPCVMLNHLVHARFTNHQYQELEDAARFRYKTISDNSIFFEVDGPYRAMILPTSKEEGKGLKKRYAVFNPDGTLAELKGFELKRRGELQLVKNFQQEIFKVFLMGSTLTECYGAVATVANRWLDVLDSRGSALRDEDLLELICENRSMSKTLAEYEGQKSTSITTAKRLGELLGQEMTKDKGLACKYIIANRPVGAPVTERAVPVAVFSSPLEVKRDFLRRWLKAPQLEDFDPRSILDWRYYWDRLASVVQKIITIPAALQKVPNPVPRVAHPDWLQKQVAELNSKYKQSTLSGFLKPAAVPDIEDLGGARTAARGKAVVKVFKRGKKGSGESGGSGDDGDDSRISEVVESQSEISASDQLIANSPPISPSESYPEFLAQQKRKWRAELAAREKRRRLFGTAKPATGVKSAVQARAETYAQSTWKILQYCATQTPGEVRVFAQIGESIQTLRFHVRKTVFLNFKPDCLPDGEIPECTVEKVSHCLPDGSTPPGLFRLSLPERRFQAEMENLASPLQSPGVAGLYEAQLTAVDRAVCRLGAACRLQDSAPGALGRGLDGGFPVESLAPADMPRNGYVEGSRFGYLYLFHIVSNQYEVFTLFDSGLPGKSKDFEEFSARAQVFVLRPSNSAPQLAGLSRAYATARSARNSALARLRHFVDYPEALEFPNVHFTDIGKLYSRVAQAVKARRSAPGAARMVFVLQTPFPAKVTKLIPAISEFPVLQLRCTEFAFPALGWELVVARRVASQILSLSTWLSHVAGLAAFANVPLCNVRADDVAYVIDVLYARRLQKNGVVLWWSRGGGSESYENPAFPAQDTPQVYSTACLDVSVENLAVTALLAGSLLHEAEGADLADAAVAQLAEDAFPAPALAVLRQLVREWWDAAVAQSTQADLLVHHLVPWVLRRNSRLYSPRLHRHVHTQSRKALAQLVAEFRRLGARPVHAGQHRVVLATNKATVAHCYAYGQYLVRAVRARPLFHYLELRVERYWDTLVWLNGVNYGGKCCGAEQLGAQQVAQESEAEADVLQLRQQWHIREYLPVALRGEFDRWVGEFISGIGKRKRVVLEAQTQRHTQVGHVVAKNQSRDEPADTFQLSEVLSELRGPLMHRVRALARKQNEAALHQQLQDEFRFPELPGSHLRLANPAFQLAKWLCAVYALGTEINLEVRALRRDLYHLFDVKEFSPEGIFVDPCKSIVVPQLMCEHCFFTEDFDVCSQDSLAFEQGNGSGNGSGSEADVEKEFKVLWQCRQCHKPFSRVAVEELLVAQVALRLREYFIQDLRCGKCGKIRQDNLSQYCGCSGGFVETESRAGLVETLRQYEKVAGYYDLRLLSAFVAEAI